MLPRVTDSGDELHPLATWWALLLTLSSLAKYHPDAWRKALDRDASRPAVAIEEGLELARELLPWMVLKALRHIEGRDATESAEPPPAR